MVHLSDEQRNIFWLTSGFFFYDEYKNIDSPLRNSEILITFFFILLCLFVNGGSRRKAEILQIEKMTFSTQFLNVKAKIH